MKKIRINNVEWSIIPFHRTTEEYDGQTCVSQLTIKFNVDQNREIVKKSLIHELVHAHLDSFGFGSYSTGQLNIEQVCEFISFNAENIIKLTEKIMRDFNL